MKLVINKCFGGFGLSPKAIVAYLKLKGKKAYFYELDRVNGKLIFDSYVKVPKDASPPFSTLVYTKDYGQKVSAKKLNVAKHYFYDRDIDRADPDLISVVEKLGKEANGQCTELEIIEIPDGIDYTIEEYDGNEHVAENHRTWY